MGNYRSLDMRGILCHSFRLHPFSLTAHDGIRLKNKLGSDGSKHKENVVPAYEVLGHSPPINDRMILDHYVQLHIQ